MTDFHVFSGDPSHSFTGFFSSTQLEGREVLVPRGLVLALEDTLANPLTLLPRQEGPFRLRAASPAPRR